jgi:hypothetical protein
MARILLLFIYFSLPAEAQHTAIPAVEQLASWEKIIIAEVKKLPASQGDSLWFLHMSAAREFKAYGLFERSLHYYQEAQRLPYKGDRSEAYVEIVHLLQLQGQSFSKELQATEKWFKENPTLLTDSISEWLKLMQGHSKQETPLIKDSYLNVWARDKRVNELMLKGRYQEAFQQLGSSPLAEVNINQKIRYDLLSTITLKKKGPPLWCESVLKTYPQSATWSMRMCRYLKAWREGKPSKETIASIREQLKTENPERLHWVKALETL